LRLDEIDERPVIADVALRDVIAPGVEDGHQLPSVSSFAMRRIQS
jgi:hypothetical protein